MPKKVSKQSDSRRMLLIGPISPAPPPFPPTVSPKGGQMFSKIYQSVRALLGKSENRRRHPRQSRRTPLILQPFDQDLQATGGPIDGMLRDISQSGVGCSCICDQKPNSPYLQITIAEDKFSAIGKIRHVTETDQPGVYLVGVEFLNDQDGN